MGVDADAEAVVEPVGAAEAYAASAIRGGIENSMLSVLCWYKYEYDKPRV